jgi:hypothetical protein
MSPNMDEEKLSALIDTARPHLPCMYDYFLGGKYNSKTDREAAQKALDVAPTIPEVIRENRSFLRRSVQWLAEQGIKQFIDVGSGLPTEGSTHEVVRKVSPDARIVYVDHEEVVKVLGQEILAGDDNTTFVIESCLKPNNILQHPDTKRLIDFSKPVALLYYAVLHFMVDEDLQTIIGPMRDAVAPGSYFVVTHFTPVEGTRHDTGEKELETVKEQYKRSGSTPIPRTEEEVEQNIMQSSGWEVIKPGVVPVNFWKPGEKVLSEEPESLIVGSIAKKL